MSPHVKTNGLMPLISEETPLIADESVSRTSSWSSLSGADMVSEKCVDDTTSMDMSEKSNYTSFRRSFQRASQHLMKAHSQLSVLIQQHTGSIGMLGSVSIAVNSLTGPAMLNIPALFSQAGLIPTITCLLFVCVLSSLCCLHMASLISKVPGNKDFRKEIEYSEAFSTFWGYKWFFSTQAIYLCCITLLNITSIVDMSQVADTVLGHWFPNGTAAIQIIRTDGIRCNWIRWDYSGCSEDDIDLGVCTPFRNLEGIIITAGKIVTVIFYFPLALLDLKENSYWQIVGFIILLITSAHFAYAFASYPEKSSSNLTLWGEDWSDLFGVVLFNFALVLTVPAWLYEREPHVDVPTTIYVSTAITIVIYLTIGILGSLAIQNVADNMLQSMMSGALGIMMQISSSVFAFGIIGLGIPLFSVLARLNLTSAGVSRSVGQGFAVYLPFTVAMFLYDGESVTSLLNWGGVIFTSLVVFILPLLLAYHVTIDFSEEGSISVYNGYIRSKDAQIVALRVLLVLAIVSVLFGLAGDVISVYAGFQ